MLLSIKPYLLFYCYKNGAHIIIYNQMTVFISWPLAYFILWNDGCNDDSAPFLQMSFNMSLFCCVSQRGKTDLSLIYVSHTIIILHWNKRIVCLLPINNITCKTIVLEVFSNGVIIRTTMLGFKSPFLNHYDIKMK